MIIDILISSALGSLFGFIIKKIFKITNKKISLIISIVSYIVIYVLLYNCMSFENMFCNIFSFAFSASMYATLYKNNYIYEGKENIKHKNINCYYCRKQIKDTSDVVICKECNTVFHISCLPKDKYCTSCGARHFIKINTNEESNNITI